MAELFTDYMFICPTRKLARGLSNYNSTYIYSFDHALSFNQYVSHLPLHQSESDSHRDRRMPLVKEKFVTVLNYHLFLARLSNQIFLLPKKKIYLFR